MSTHTLKDANYRVIGYIETGSDGAQVIKNEAYQVLVYYDSRQNQTKNARYQVIGHGNLLTTLLVSA